MTIHRPHKGSASPSLYKRPNAVFDRPIQYLIRLFIPLLAILAFLSSETQGTLFAPLSELPWVYILAALVAYSVAQILRASRLAMIAAPITKLTVRSLILLHFHTTVMVLVIPFKLGELYRAREIAILSKDWAKALLVVLVERTADAFILIFLCVLLIALNIQFPNYVVFVAAMLAAILLLALFVVTIVVPALRDAQRYIFLHHISPLSCALLQAISTFRLAIEVTRKAVAGKSALLLGITLIIWALEFLTAAALIQVSALSLDAYLSVNILAPLLPQTDGLSGELGLVFIWLAFLVFAWAVSLPFYLLFAEKPRTSAKTASDAASLANSLKPRGLAVGKMHIHYGD